MNAGTNICGPPAPSTLTPENTTEAYESVNDRVQEGPHAGWSYFERLIVWDAFRRKPRPRQTTSGYDETSVPRRRRTGSATASDSSSTLSEENGRKGGSSTYAHLYQCSAWRVVPPKRRPSARLGVGEPSGEEIFVESRQNF